MIADQPARLSRRSRRRPRSRRRATAPRAPWRRYRQKGRARAGRRSWVRGGCEDVEHRLADAVGGGADPVVHGRQQRLAAELAGDDAHRSYRLAADGGTARTGRAGGPEPRGRLARGAAATRARLVAGRARDAVCRQPMRAACRRRSGRSRIVRARACKAASAGRGPASVDSRRIGRAWADRHPPSVRGA